MIALGLDGQPYINRLELNSSGRANAARAKRVPAAVRELLSKYQPGVFLTATEVDFDTQTHRAELVPSWEQWTAS